MTVPAPTLRGRVHQNLYLPVGARTVEALVTVDATGGHRDGAGPPTAVEVVIVDASRSMGEPTDKLRHAVAATVAALAEMRDGVRFAVIAGTHEASMVYPAHPGTVPATAATRAEAAAALEGLVAGGGTAIGTWLTLAREILSAHPDAIRHAILLTDGNDEHETPAQLAAAVAACAGVFRCDGRGIGDDWIVPELRRVTRDLQGSFGPIAEPAAMAEDFRALVAASMRKEVAELALQVWTPVGARVRLVKQTAPDVLDLTGRRVAAGERVAHYPTGAWGTEERDFHVALEVTPAEVDQERLAGRLSFVRMLPDGATGAVEQQFTRTRRDGAREAHPEALVVGVWTDDPRRDTEPHPLVLLSNDQSTLERLVERAAGAYRDHHLLEAGEWLDEIRPRARAAGMAELVDRIDAVRDPATGTYELDDAAVQAIEIQSSSLPRPAPVEDRGGAGSDGAGDRT